MNFPITIAHIHTYIHECCHLCNSTSRSESSLRRLIAIVSPDLFTTLIAILSSKFIHLPRELVKEEWKIHSQLVTWPLMTKGPAGKG